MLAPEWWWLHRGMQHVNMHAAVAATTCVKSRAKSSTLTTHCAVPALISCHPRICAPRLALERSRCSVHLGRLEVEAARLEVETTRVQVEATREPAQEARARPLHQ
jgi:hypothetical protein